LVTAPRSHLAPFREGLRPWLVLARNAIPVLGVYWLGWSAGLAVFQIWFDGVTALGAMLALHMRAVIVTDSKARPPAGIPLVALPVAWLVLLALLGIPYWFTLFLFKTPLFQANFWDAVFGDPVMIAALLFAVISNVVEEFRRGYERMDAAQARLEFNWDFSMHLARIGALMIAGFFFGKHIMLPLALALAYVEIYPMRSLRLMGGHRTLEAGNENRSRD
jgi:hypothetical protein